MSALLQLLSDVGITRDLVPVGREVAGVVLQGCNIQATGNITLIVPVYMSAYMFVRLTCQWVCFL